MTPSISPRRRQSVRTQLVWWNILALALLLAALGVVVRTLVRTTIMGSVDRELDGRTRPFVDHREERHGGPGGGGPPGPPDGRGRPDRPRFETNPYFPRRFDLEGHALGPFQRSEPLWDPAGFAIARMGKPHYFTVVVGGDPIRVLSRPFPRQGPIEGVIQAPYPLADLDRALRGLDRVLLTLLPFALLCAGLGGAWLTDRVLRRVRRLTQAAGNIGARDLSERLPVTGSDEFSELAETFNGLLGRLETAFGRQQRLIEQQRRFTADASHELKTPLTIIQGNTSLALSGHPDQAEYAQAMGEIGMAAETMSRLVRDLILLAQSDSGRLGQGRIELLLREVLERAVARVPRPAAAVCLSISDESLSLPGNEEELVRLFTNLLTNAARHTPAVGKDHAGRPARRGRGRRHGRGHRGRHRARAPAPFGRALLPRRQRPRPPGRWDGAWPVHRAQHRGGARRDDRVCQRSGRRHDGDGDASGGGVRAQGKVIGRLPPNRGGAMETVVPKEKRLTLTEGMQVRVLPVSSLRHGLRGS